MPGDSELRSDNPVGQWLLVTGPFELELLAEQCTCKRYIMQSRAAETAKDHSVLEV